MIETKNRFFAWAPCVILMVLFFIFCHVYRTTTLEPVAPTFSDGKVVFSVPCLKHINDLEQRKILFFNFLRPIVESENRRVEKIRQSVISLLDKINENKIVSDQEILWLTVVATSYGLKTFNPNDRDMHNLFLKRVDTVPTSLALAQAANESAWGTSRFAQKGNNLFGHWTYKKGSGLVPKQRDQGKTHEIARFVSVNASVRRYIHNLNTNNSYKKLRDLRQSMRNNDLDPTGLALTEGLLNYSSLGRAYIDSIRSMIITNKKHMYL